jgi:hypothetical protein
MSTATTDCFVSSSLKSSMREFLQAKKKKNDEKILFSFAFFSQVTKEGLLGALLEGFDTHFGKV